LLTRTDTVIVPGTIAVETEGLKPLFWKPILAQLRVESTASTNLATVLIAIVMNMVNGKNFGSVLTTARTLPTIGCKRFLTKIGMPEHHRGFLDRLLAHLFEPIAIIAQQLGSRFRKTVLTKPPVEAMTSANSPAMISAIIPNMVNREKRRMRFATLCTLPAIGSKNLITKLISISLQLLTTLLTQVSYKSRANNARATHTLLSSLNRTRATSLVLMGTNCLLLFRRLGKKSITLLLDDLLTVHKVLIMATRLAGKAKFFASTFSMPELRGFRKIAATAGAMFQRDLTKVKEHTLNEVLWYNTIHTMRVSLSCRHGPDCASNTIWAPPHLVSPLYHRSA
jgi:hypothetical protein